ncbi:MAG: hypothetical protein M3Q81_05765, partial [bacterium]|nr:hypothetical protein [bacterium]
YSSVRGTDIDTFTDTLSRERTDTVAAPMEIPATVPEKYKRFKGMKRPRPADQELPTLYKELVLPKPEKPKEKKQSAKTERAAKEQEEAQSNLQQFVQHFDPKLQLGEYLPLCIKFAEGMTAKNFPQHLAVFHELLNTTYTVPTAVPELNGRSSVIALIFLINYAAYLSGQSLDEVMRHWKNYSQKS